MAPQIRALQPRGEGAPGLQVACLFARNLKHHNETIKVTDLRSIEENLRVIHNSDGFSDTTSLQSNRSSADAGGVLLIELASELLERIGALAVSAESGSGLRKQALSCLRLVFECLSSHSSRLSYFAPLLLAQLGLAMTSPNLAVQSISLQLLQILLEHLPSNTISSYYFNNQILFFLFNLRFSSLVSRLLAYRFCRRDLRKPASSAAPRSGPVLETGCASRRARLLANSGARAESPPAELELLRLSALSRSRTSARRSRTRGGARVARAAHRSPASPRASPRTRRPPLGARPNNNWR